ncbi:TPA: hypothetical protein PGG59_005282 [Raoultella planticola]|nr:hypothetical protein [Raoultella planticola]
MKKIVTALSLLASCLSAHAVTTDVVTAAQNLTNGTEITAIYRPTFVSLPTSSLAEGREVGVFLVSDSTGVGAIYSASFMPDYQQYAGVGTGIRPGLGYMKGPTGSMDDSINVRLLGWDVVGNTVQTLTPEPNASLRLVIDRLDAVPPLAGLHTTQVQFTVVI